MLHIPAGSTDKIYSTGTIGGNFTPGKTYGISFNYKRNGKYLWEGNRPGRAFKIMWPNNLPCGDPYIWETIDEREWESMVNGYRISDQFFLEADGYWDFEPSF